MKTKGFSILEMFLVIGILGIIVSIGFLSLPNLNSSIALGKSVKAVISTFEEARSLTLASKEDSQYGVHIGEESVILFVGENYSPADSRNTITAVSSLVGIRNIELDGGGEEVVFKRLTGATDNGGTFELYLKSDPLIMRTVTVNPSGLVDENI